MPGPLPPERPTAPDEGSGADSEADRPGPPGAPASGDPEDDAPGASDGVDPKEDLLPVPGHMRYGCVGAISSLFWPWFFSACSPASSQGSHKVLGGSVNIESSQLLPP